MTSVLPNSLLVFAQHTLGSLWHISGGLVFAGLVLTRFSYCILFFCLTYLFPFLYLLEVIFPLSPLRAPRDLL